MRPPAVLFVDQSGELGGAELSLLDIVRGHHGLSVVCLFGDGRFGDRLREAGVPVRTIGLGAAANVRRRSGIRALLAAPALMAAVIRLAWMARAFEVIHANTMKAFVVAALGRPLHRRPVVWHLRDLLTDEHFGGLTRRGVARLGRMAAAEVIANSTATAEALRQAGGPRARVIHNGVDASLFESGNRVSARKSLLADTGLAAGQPTVGIFSRLAEWKGQAVLLEALVRLPDVQAILVGGPLFGEEAYEAELRSVIATRGLGARVRMLGFRSDAPRLMAGVDVAVHASVAAEPFGRVIVEAMLAGTPVIATRAGGAIELVEDGETGRLVAPGDPEALAAAIGALVDDPARGRRTADRARTAARARFSLQPCLEAVEAVLAEVRDDKRSL
ncbi:glycosyltransferase family 4 protein [Brevundimonas sp. PAMC22021]|uniref:glycosyltransferase family 4 protein n=1 Tax=Brevundimonas sp. PAMC22021 TaxID=2861285 RepID=UPI001C62F601|nr:glycosyltransferase family 4 protein [Brevundimonas sp. PAMC22021]QYF87656.1 glycosyltransferase family 4 protein [Brevundimonas sp. PAMC22021]